MKKDFDNLYEDKQTAIIYEDEDPSKPTIKKIPFKIRSTRNTHLDVAYKELSLLTNTFTAELKDPVDEKHNELFDELAAFLERTQNVRGWVENEREFVKK